jgi:hypothetical protein
MQLLQIRVDLEARAGGGPKPGEAWYVRKCFLAQNPRSPGERSKTRSVVGRLGQEHPYEGGQEMATTVPSATRDARTTRILARFTPTSNVTTEQYDDTIHRLEKVGDWPPAGLDYHVAFKADGKFRVSEIWDSREQFEAFGQRLMPVLDEVGIEPGQPEMLEIHNIIKR